MMAATVGNVSFHLVPHFTMLFHVPTLENEKISCDARHQGCTDPGLHTDDVVVRLHKWS